MQPEHQTLLGDDDDDDDDDEPPLLVSLDPPPKDDAPETSTTTTVPSATPTAASTAPAPVPTSSLAPCPVTILSGFLGSGKTTLIQYILQSPHHGKRIAVIENEFGQGGLDVESLIVRDNGNKNQKGEGESSSSALADLIELANGCVCCTVKDSLVTTLESLVEKKTDLDYILIECSGMANPGPIASLFWLDDALDSRLRLDGIVTICDAAHIAEQLETTQEAAQQIAYADRILLNKIDLLEEKNGGKQQQQQKQQQQFQTADSLVALIRQFHPLAPIRQTSYSSVPDLDWILDAKCFDSDRFQAVEEAIRQIPLQLDHDHSHNHAHDDGDDCAVCQAASTGAEPDAANAAPSHTHTSGITTIALQESGTLDLQLFNRWLASVLWPNQDAANATLQSLIQDETKAAAHQSSLQNDESQRIFRMKGIVSVKQYTGSDTFDEAYLPDGDCLGEGKNGSVGEDNIMMMRDRRRFILQSVHDLWDLYPAGDSLQWQTEEERTCKVVVIGKNLDETGLRQGYRECLI